MSPSESQLRAALHDGEGDAPDADALISHALRVRRDRRRRFNAVAGGVAAVAFVGVGATVLVALGRGGDEAGGGSGAQAASGRGADTHPAVTAAAGGAFARSATAPAAAPYQNASSAAAQAKPGPTARAAARACPTQPDRFLLPGGGGSGQFGSTDPLFAGTVAALKVCAYPVRANATPRSTVVSGTEARQLANTLEAAPATRSASKCPPNTDYVGGTIEIFAVDTQGRPIKPVVITLDCTSSQATNGTAVRFVTNIPDRYVELLVPSSSKSTAGTVPGRVTGSPVR